MCVVIHIEFGGICLAHTTVCGTHKSITWVNRGKEDIIEYEGIQFRIHFSYLL